MTQTRRTIQSRHVYFCYMQLFTDTQPPIEACAPICFIEKHVFIIVIKMGVFITKKASEKWLSDMKSLPALERAQKYRGILQSANVSSVTA